MTEPTVLLSSPPPDPEEAHRRHRRGFVVGAGPGGVLLPTLVAVVVGPVADTAVGTTKAALRAGPLPRRAPEPADALTRIDVCDVLDPPALAAVLHREYRTPLGGTGVESLQITVALPGAPELACDEARRLAGNAVSALDGWR